MQGRLTVRADLIFEEYIGIDIHQKLLVMRENNSNVIPRRGSRRQPSSFPPPEKAHVIEDDIQPPDKELEILNKINMDVSSMPSFNLLDEDFLDEGEPAVEAEDDECKIITEQTVFDHILEKSKSFPDLVSSNNSYFPSPKTLILPRKRCCVKQLDLYSAIEETERNKTQRQILDIPSSHLKEVERNGLVTDKCPTPKHQITARKDREKLSPKCEDIIFKPLNGETVFDHIRKKAKDFLVPAILTREHYQPEFCDTAVFDPLKVTNSNKVQRDTVVILDSGPEEKERDACNAIESFHVKDNNIFAGTGSACWTYKTLDLSPKLPNTNADLASIRSSCFSNSPGSFTKSSMKQFCSPFGSKRQCCSMATGEKNEEADSFLGFKSIFSFL